MADILPFKAPNNNSAKKASTLCRQGHHKWVIVTSQKFDVKQGRLVTVSECRRCGKRKVAAL
ncbi:hypothetical protein [Oceanicoccus sagamiensis]|uniref:Uncharacterized protein n=1 Tax=Oceanicoccus sagamiensis TaxID=716816 RepID=A0A1X9N901_9GAMM|nr:hypothetical protein [Oceanicoccus sagamiensis]ARN73564.1 hypothetical protein BST96_05180 [Oceanicoccus sagamiensis]